MEMRHTPRPDPETYATLTAELSRWRADLAKRRAAAKSRAEGARIEAEARELLEKSLPAMMRCWLGTPWDFNGTAEGPGRGKIACGYFVSTVLKDAGFQVDRYRLAQQPSENILRSFLPKDACSLTVGESYSTFSKRLSGRENGIYLVGLDSHVGFVVVRDGGFRFIHSSGARPWCVVEESSENAAVLRKSNWRLLGNLTGDAGAVKRWLAAEKIVVRGT